MSAVRYASPYTGSGRNYVHTTIHAATPSMAQAPVASMSSTSRGLGSCGVSTPIDTRTLNVVPVSGIYTTASAIKGGVTTYSADRPRGGAKKSQAYPGGYTSDCECPWIFDEENGTFTCPICSCEVDVLDDIDPSGHFHCDCDPCRCPIGDGWQVWLMMALLAAAYAVRRNRKITQQAILAV